MRAEIITIGDEILIGQIVDTNSAWLGAHLGDVGVQVIQITSVQDNKKSIIDSFNAAFARADLVFVTGGLGPTKDDITKHTLAEYFKSPLVRDESTYNYLCEMMQAKGYDFNVLNQGQADVPACCMVLHNANGTAPGMWFEKEGKILISMPGVPFEMKAMISDMVIPVLKQRFDLKSIIHKTAITFGIPESALALRIEEWENGLPPYIKLAYLPNPKQIKLRLSSYDVDGVAILAEIDALFDKLKNIIPDNFLGFSGATLESVVAGILIDRVETLSVAESCSGGALASAFTAMSGASKYFLGGVISYSNDVKHKVLGVSSDDLDRYGAVSEQVAKAMAVGIRNLTGSTYSISTTGIAGPEGGSEYKPVGTVWIAIATPKGVYTKKKVFGNLRDENINRTVATSIDFLREHLLLKHK